MKDTTPPPILYHYTSMSSLFYILNDVKTTYDKIKIRATNASFMNDPSEYKYLIGCVIDKMKEEMSTRPEVEDLDWKTVEKLSNDLDDLTGTPAIFSLSEHRDELPMWQTYGHKGQGVAIGFNTKYLEEADFENWKLKKCKYKWEDEIKKRIDTDAIKRCFEKDPNYTKENKIALYLISFMEQRTELKHPAYHYENEWRMVSDEPQKYLYRESGGLIIPYLEFELYALAIKEIIIGPTANPDLSEKSLFNFLNDHRIHCNRERSKIPYALL